MATCKVCCVCTYVAPYLLQCKYLVILLAASELLARSKALQRKVKDRAMKKSLTMKKHIPVSDQYMRLRLKLVSTVYV